MNQVICMPESKVQMLDHLDLNEVCEMFADKLLIAPFKSVTGEMVFCIVALARKKTLGHYALENIPPPPKMNCPVAACGT